MGAAWEWRTFQSWQGTTSAVEMAAHLARKLAIPGPSNSAAETDLYLVLPGQKHNVKVRRGALELKRQIRRLPGGFSLWEDKEVLPFPLSEGSLARIVGSLPLRGREPPLRAASSSRDFLDALRHTHPQLRVISLVKSRTRMDNGRARLEIADLELPGLAQWVSCCVDGYSPDAVWELVHRSGLKGTGRELSYVDLLHEAVWWYPNLTREVTAWHGARSG